MRSVVASADRYAMRYLPARFPYRDGFVTRVLISLLTFGSVYYILNEIHMKTYVWQSTEMASTLSLEAERGTCWLTPPSLNEVKQMKHIDYGKSRLKIGMIMLYDEGQQLGGEWDKGLMKDVVENHLKYAKMNGYTPIIANDIINSTRPSAWSKLLAIEKYLPYYDYLLYLDMDTIIMDLDIKLESFIMATGPCADIIMSEDWNGPNTGIWLIKNSKWSQWFVQHAYELGEPLVQKRSAVGGTKHPFEYEQRVFHYLLESKVWKDRNLPKYPGGNGATPVETSHRAVGDIRKHVSVLPQCALNSYCLHPMDTRGLPQDGSRYVEGDFLIHFAGKKGKIKADLMRRFLKVSRRGEEKLTKTM